MGKMFLRQGPLPPAQMIVSLVLDDTPHLVAKRNASASFLQFGALVGSSPPDVISAESDINAWAYRPIRGLISAGEQFNIDLKAPAFPEIYTFVFMNTSDFNMTLSEVTADMLSIYSATFTRGCAAP